MEEAPVVDGQVKAGAAESVEEYFFRSSPDTPITLRTDTFNDASGTSEVFLTLTTDFLSYTVRSLKTQQETPKRALPLNTFLAAIVGKQTVRVIYYPLDRSSNVRRRCTLDFYMPSPERAIDWAKSINDALYGAPRQRRHVLVLVNPFSGTKKAPQVWKDTVMPLWKETGMTFEMVQTEYPGHAKNIAKTVNVDAYDAMVTISGDGLFCEVVNGLLSRADWDSAVRLPLAVIPGGSGNALAYAAGMGDPETAAFCIARGRARPFDVATVLQEGYRLSSFLMVSWGIVADVDFESERFRWMGAARFTVSALQRIASLRLYSGKFSYYPDPSWSGKENAVRCTTTKCPRCMAFTSRPARPTASTSVQWESNKIILPKEQQEQGQGEGNNSNNKSSPALSSSPLPPGSPFFGQEVASLPQGPPTPLLDSLSSPDAPSSPWVHEEGSGYVLFTASNATHIAADMHTAPYAHWSDGTWDIIVVKELPRTQLVKLMLSLEKGEHVQSPDIRYVKARAFVLEPGPASPATTEPSYLDVDGERLPLYGRVAAEMHRGFLNLVTLF